MKRICLLIVILVYALAPSWAVDAPALTCPGVTAHVTIYDYSGPFVADFCVYSFQDTGADLMLTGGDPNTDGIFRNGFDSP